MVRLSKIFGGRRPADALRDERGASAIEFALLAPALVLACMATVDLGVAITQQMTIDHSLRAGAEGAMADLGQPKVRELVEGTAAQSFTIASTDSTATEISTHNSALTVDVTRYCACPESVSTAVNCSGSSTCAGSAKPYHYYRLAAEKTYDAMLLPDFKLRGAMLVQAQ